jgi:hypothetical protein
MYGLTPDEVLAGPRDRYSYPAVGSWFCPADSELSGVFDVGTRRRLDGRWDPLDDPGREQGSGCRRWLPRRCGVVFDRE